MTTNWIKEPLRMEKHGDYAHVYVKLVDGAEARVYIGGEVFEDFRHGIHQVWVKHKKTLDITPPKEVE